VRFFTLLFFSIILSISCYKSEKVSIILKDSQCGNVAQKQHIVIDDDKEWDALHKNFLQTKPLNNLTDQELGAFIFLGERSSSGYSLDFIESYSTEEEFFIVVAEVRPGEFDPVLAVMTYPCIVLKFPKTDKTIKVIYK